MTTWRLMDGASGRPGVGSSGTQPPGSPAAYSGNYIAGLSFQASAAVWMQGYWWYVPAGGDTTPVKFALWQQGGSSDNLGLGTLVTGSTVTSGTLTTGQWNFTALAAPLALSQQSMYLAAMGMSTTVGFPDTTHQFGAGNPYASGITNGPLYAPPTNNSLPFVQMPFSTAGSDPAVTMPVTNDLDDLLWVDIQVTDTAPGGASYRTWPSRPYSLGDGTNSGVSSNTNGYTMAMQFSLTQPCKLGKIWFYSGTAQFGATAAAALPGRCGIWDVSSTTVVSGTDNSSPSWKKPDGTAGSAGGGWLYCDYSAANITLNASQQYKVAVWYAGGATWRTVYPDNSANYWSGTGTGANGFTYGPLVVPNAAGASPYQDSWNGPNLAWAYPGSSSAAENDWIDVEVTPATAAPQYAYTMRMMP